MRAIDWQNFLHDQRDRHGKVVFTTTELANVSSLGPPSLRTALQRLVRRGIIQRYAKGRYGLPGAVTPEALVTSLDPAAYVTGVYALYLHQTVTQAPSEISCFTNRRHNRSRERATALGRIVFVCVTGPVYRYPRNGAAASPEQAMCDFVHLCRRRGVIPRHVVTFRNIDRLSMGGLQEHLPRYPATVGREVEKLLRAFL